MKRSTSTASKVRRRHPRRAGSPAQGQPSAVRRLLAVFRQELETLYGPRLVQLVLYGSQARADAHTGSDIDVLVVLKGSVAPPREIARLGPLASSLSLRAGVTLSCHFVSARRFASEQSPPLINVRREGVAV